MSGQAQFFDSHCHLQAAPIGAELEAVVQACEEQGVRGFAVQGTCQRDWPLVREICARIDGATPFYGLHPWELASRTDSWERELAELLDEGGCGVGEIGLDRWIEGWSAKEQERIFIKQLEMAAERGLPVSIHCLRAWGPLAELMERERAIARLAMIHSFGGSAEMAERLLRAGCRLSFSASVLEPKRKRAREALRATPLDRLLLETDAPDMLPADPAPPFTLGGADGRPANHPANLAWIAQRIADIRMEPMEKVAEAAWDNARRFLRNVSQ